MILTPLRKVGLIAAGGVLFIGGFWAYIAMREQASRELAIAEERERQAQVLAEADRKREAEKALERENTAKLIEANVAMAQRLEQSIAANNARAIRERSAALAPKSLDQAIKDAIEQLQVTPKPEADNRVSITQAELQSFTAMKIELDRLARNDMERERQVRVLEDTNRRLVDQATGYEESLRSKDAVIASQKQAIDAYAKVAKRSKWRKFGSVMGKVGLAVLPGVAAALVLK